MPSPKIVQLLSEVNGEKLLLEMTQVSDRFQTCIKQCDGSESVLATSIEGHAESAPNADPDWPRSSPLQEVVPQSNADGDFLAGVGQCGKSHWSVIVTPLKDVLGFEFDFACRAKAEPVWLGSTYQLGSAEGGSPSLDIDVSLGEKGSAEKPDVKIIQPTRPLPDAYPATIQWRYRLVFGV